MKKNLLLLVVVATYFFSGNCKKDPVPVPVDPCAGVNMSVQATGVNATSGSNGSINITAPVGSGITYSLNGAAAVSTTTFSNLAAGTYTITSKNANNCTGTGSVTIISDPCQGKTITVSTPTIVGSTPCAANDGSVTVAATGSTGFTYNIGTGAFQAGATFTGLAAGTYTVGARDVDGCVKTASVTVGSKPAGTLFTAVKGVINTSCLSCHNTNNASGGTSFSTDCNIVDKWDRIKARCIDGTPSFMPQGGQLPASEKAKITNWVNAGHKFTD